MSPGEVAEETTGVIIDWWRGLAAKEARAIVLEDLDLADPSTMALIDRAVAEGLGPGIFLILTARPGGVMPQVGPDDIIELQPLPDEDARELLEALSPSIEDAVEDLIDLSGGNPLFLRELARAHDKSGKVVPGGLRDLLMARLDAAGDLELAQIASVIGRTIDPRLLEAVAGNAEPRPADRRSRRPGHPEPITTITPDAASASCPSCWGRPPTPPFPPATARWSTPSWPTSTSQVRAGWRAPASPPSISTAPLATRRRPRLISMPPKRRPPGAPSPRRCATWGGHGSWPRTSSPPDTGDELKRVAVLRSSFVYIAREGFGSEAAQCGGLTRRPAGATRLGDPLGGPSPHRVLHCDHPRATTGGRGDRRGSRGRPGEWPPSRIASKSRRRSCSPEVSTTSGWDGSPAPRSSFERALESYQGPPRHGAPWPDYPLPTDLPATANAQLIPIYWIQGDRSLSDAAASRAIKAAESVPYPMDAFNLAYAVGYVGWVNLMDDEVAKALDAQRQQGDLGREHGFAMWEALADAFEAVAAAQLEPTEELADELARRRAAAAMTAGSSFQPYLLATEGEIRLRAGSPGRALELVEESLALAEATSEFIYLPETYRIRAAARPDPDDARGDLTLALETAMTQDAHIFTLRALLDLSRLPEPPDDLSERLTKVLGEMGEPETYKEHARAQLILSSVR